MAKHYYYLVASLPMLSYDMDKTMSEDDFFDLTSSVLSEKDYQTVQNSRIVPVEEKPKNSSLQKWNDWERSIRNELVKMRAGKKSVDSEKYVVPGSIEAGTLEIAREAFSASTPLEAENILNRARWEFLEFLEAGHNFDLDLVIIYFLKLQILIRKTKINKETGKESFEKVYANILSANDERKQA